MFKIENIQISELKDGKYIRPKRLEYLQDGIRKSWEIVQSYDSVAILIYHKDRDSFILVKQFRPAVYINDNRYTNTYELCAGLIDKDKTLEEIASDEVEEECGYRVEPSQLQKVTTFFTNVGFAGAKQYLFYVEVDESMRVGKGGGIDGEVIYLEYLPVSEAKEFIFNEQYAKTPGLMLSFYWWFDKFKKYK
ncbi:MAG TPA: NUDIX domain-containing protein [Campylobacterales bacterium]|nr:NUDIX domain-containing protein [Campylobacterales bacterium]